MPYRTIPKPLKATVLKTRAKPGYKAFRDAMRATPGAVFLARGRSLWYSCPCGCGSTYPLPIRPKGEPVERPSWELSGYPDAPTLSPSIDHKDHWHGWLQGGFWKQA